MLIDISRPINPGMAIYPGNTDVILKQISEATVTSSALTSISFGSHTGTHIDAPSHIKAGAARVGVYPLEQFIGEAQVVDLSDISSVISASDST